MRHYTFEKYVLGLTLFTSALMVLVATL